MKTLRVCFMLTLVAIGTLAARAVSAQETGQVYEVSLSGGFVQSLANDAGQDVVVKGQFATQHILNLARGRSADSVPPANEKLAVVILFNDDDSTEGALIVYDTNTQSNLVGICELDLGGAIDSAKGKGEVAMAGSYGDVGNFTYGWFAMAGKATVSGMDTPTPSVSFKGALQAVLRGNDGEDFEVVVSKGKAAFLGRLGTLVFN